MHGTAADINHRVHTNENQHNYILYWNKITQTHDTMGESDFKALLYIKKKKTNKEGEREREK